ncbi:MAG: glycosyl hydrolase family 28-related protein, partial [Planctomycetia bacterium]
MSRRSVLGSLALLLSTFFGAVSPAADAPPRYGRIVFPDDASVLDVRAEYGAKGDGKTDDTAALQKALDDSSGPTANNRSAVVYLPNGVYRLTGTLVCNRGAGGAGVGPWVYGESRDGVVLKLDDRVADCKSVIRTHPNDDGGSSANWFMRNLRHFTIDVGDNPDTDGVRYVATNTGILQDLRIVGRGKIGVNSAVLTESGPSLIQDVEIDGFETGVATAWAYGQTLSRVTVRNCKKVGVTVIANVVGIEDLVVENTPQALFVDYPNDWTWWSGVVAMVGGRFTNGTPSDLPAVRNRGVLYARDLKSEGFAQVLTGETPGGSVSGNVVDEYNSHPVMKLFDDSSVQSLRLP